MRFCDAHCHTHVYTNPKDLIRYCEKSGIEILSVTNDKESYKYCKNKGIPNLAIGIHPDIAPKINEKDLEFIENEIKNDSCHLIGEIGLDYSPKNISSRNRQIEVFKIILEIAEKYRTPVNVHSYRAVKDVIEILDSYKNFHVLLHWFTGSLTELRMAIDRGYLVGVTPSILKSKNVRKIVLNTPIENILTESDSPVNKWTPLDIPKVVAKIAEIKKISMKNVSNAVYNNFIRYTKRKSSYLNE